METLIVSTAILFVLVALTSGLILRKMYAHPVTSRLQGPANGHLRTSDTDLAVRVRELEEAVERLQRKVEE